MRVLLHPWSSGGSGLSNDSGVLMILPYGKMLRDEGAVVYLSLPAGSQMEVPEGIEPMYGSIPKGVWWETQLGVVPDRVVSMFNTVNGPAPIDLIVTSNPGSAATFPAALRGGHEGDPIPVVLDPPGVISSDGKEDGFVPRGHAGRELAAIGYARSFGVYATEGEMRRARSLVEEHLSSYWIAEFDRKSRVLPRDFDSSGFEKRQFGNPDEFRVLYTGRANSTKRFRETVEVFERIRAVRNDVQIVLNGMSEGRINRFLPGGWANARWFEMYPPMPRSEFYDLLMSCHIGVLMSSYEAGPTATQEAIAAGVMMIVPQEEWSIEALGKDYPLMARNFDDVENLILDIVNNYPKWVRKWKPHRKKILERGARTEMNVLRQEVLDAALESSSFRRLEQYDAIVDWLRHSGMDTITLPALFKSVQHVLQTIKQRTNATGVLHAQFKHADMLDGPVVRYDVKKILEAYDGKD